MTTPNPLTLLDLHTRAWALHLEGRLSSQQFELVLDLLSTLRRDMSAEVVGP